MTRTVELSSTSTDDISPSACAETVSFPAHPAGEFVYPPEPVAIEMIPAARALDGLREDWERLVETAAGSVFETPVWVLNYWRYQLEQRGKVQFLVGRSTDGEMVGLVPLVHRTHLGLAPVRSAVHATGEYPSDWLCLPAYADGFAAAICDALLGRPGARTRVALSVVPESSPLLRAMVRQCERRELPHQLRPARQIPIVDTAAVGAPLPLRAKYRRELRRRWRALEQHAPLRFDTCTDLESLPAAFDELVRVEGESWKGEQGTAIGSKPSTRRFWWELAREAAERSWLRLDLLRLGDDVISGQLGLRFKGRYYCLKVGYDPRWSRFGPGALLTRHVIESSVADPGVEVYDFAGTAQPYMWNWTERFYQTWTLSAGASRARRGG